MEVVCVIPARGGSRGIIKKNICMINGRPLISYMIEQALSSRCKPAVYVSTDCDEIEAVASKYGAKVVRQPREISQDTSSSELSLLYALGEIARINHRMPELLVFLQCTSPLTLAADIDGTIDALVEDEADTSLAVTPFHYFLWKKNQEGDAVGVNHDKRVRMRRQDKDPEYLETGAVYVMKAALFAERRHRFFGKTTFHVMPRERVFEIDDPADVLIAESMLKIATTGASHDN